MRAVHTEAVRQQALETFHRRDLFLVYGSVIQQSLIFSVRETQRAGPGLGLPFGGALRFNETTFLQKPNNRT